MIFALVAYLGMFVGVFALSSLAAGAVVHRRRERSRPARIDSKYLNEPTALDRREAMYARINADEIECGMEPSEWIPWWPEPEPEAQTVLAPGLSVVQANHRQHCTCPACVERKKTALDSLITENEALAQSVRLMEQEEKRLRKTMSNAASPPASGAFPSGYYDDCSSLAEAKIRRTAMEMHRLGMTDTDEVRQRMTKVYAFGQAEPVAEVLAPEDEPWLWHAFGDAGLLRGMFGLYEKVPVPPGWHIIEEHPERLQGNSKLVTIAPVVVDMGDEFWPVRYGRTGHGWMLNPGEHRK